MARPLSTRITRKHVLSALAIIFAFALLAFWREARIALACALFILIGAFSTFYKRFVHIPIIHFELVKLGTILIAASYGALPGAIVGLAGGLSGKILSGRINPDLIGTIIATITIATLASAFRETPIALLGIGLTLLYHAITFVFALMFGENPATMLVKQATNTIFNAFIFLTIAGPVQSLLR